MPWAGSVDHKMTLRALFCPLAALRWVLDRLLAPSRDSQGRHHGGVQRGPVPVDAIGLSQFFEQHLVQPTPDTRLVSVSQPAPACHPAPIPYLGIWAGRYSQGMPVFSTNRIPSPSAPPDPTPGPTLGAVRPWASTVPARAAARAAPTTHQATVLAPWHPPP
jgi:hypothetical protein